MNTNRLQALLNNHLRRHGSIKLLLPDSMVLEIGVNQLDYEGKLRNTENYCWVIASQEDRMAVLDSYNLGVRYVDDKNKLIFEDEIITSEGQKVKRLDVV